MTASNGKCLVVLLGGIIAIALWCSRGGLAAQGIVLDTGEEKVTVMQDELDRGMKIFDEQCSTCHSNKEMIANNDTVNLTDKKWKHGGKVADIEKTIREGVPDTDMLPLKDKLLPREIRTVARYVLYLNYGKEAAK
jgi:cytochrome c oxidase cbb3-type subunit 3